MHTFRQSGPSHPQLASFFLHYLYLAWDLLLAPLLEERMIYMLIELLTSASRPFLCVPGSSLFLGVSLPMSHSKRDFPRPFYLKYIPLLFYHTFYVIYYVIKYLFSFISCLFFLLYHILFKNRDHDNFVYHHISST